MTSLAELAVRIREAIPLIESETFVEGSLLMQLNEIVRAGAEVVQSQSSTSASCDVREYCRALEELSSCLQRWESRLLDRKLHVANELRHLHNADQWARSSSYTF